MYQHESYVYLDEAVSNALYPDLKNKNLRNIGLERLGEIHRYYGDWQLRQLKYLA